MKPIMARVGGRKVPVLVKCKGGYRPATMAEVRRAKTGRVLRRNPQWLQGSVPHSVAGIGQVQRFRDASGKLKGELFPGDRLLVHNPRRKRARKPYPRALASKYIRQEIRAEKRKPKTRRRSAAQLKAIGISRARAAAKRRNPYVVTDIFEENTLNALKERANSLHAQARSGRVRPVDAEVFANIVKGVVALAERPIGPLPTGYEGMRRRAPKRRSR